jgi:hypothetical protein
MSIGQWILSKIALWMRINGALRITMSEVI